jgi:hypothetical protein
MFVGGGCLVLRRFLLGMTVVFAENAKRAWYRGVKFRIIVEKPEEAKDSDIAMKFSRKSSFCNIRFLPGHPKTVARAYATTERRLLL